MTHFAPSRSHRNAQQRNLLLSRVTSEWNNTYERAYRGTVSLFVDFKAVLLLLLARMIHAPIGPIDLMDIEGMQARKTGPVLGNAGGPVPLQFSEEALEVGDERSGYKKEVSALNIGQRSDNGFTSFREAIANGQKDNFVVDVQPPEVKSEQCHRWRKVICCFRG